MTSNAATSQTDVMFVGRANIDLTLRVPRRPSPSQTVFATSLATTAGGKSLNQAIAVARLGGRACLVGNAGADPWGQTLKATLLEVGVDVSHFGLLPGVTTGTAVIEVTTDGENYLVLAVSPATELTAAQVDAARSETAAAVVSVQLDLPPEPVIAALAKTPQGTVRVGNLVPHPDLDHGLLKHLDVLVLNQHEATTLLGAELDPLTAAQQLRRHGPTAVVVTAGADGAAYSQLDGADLVDAAAVPVVDTTGAGDAFLGSLTLDLARGAPLPSAVANAVQVGAQAVQHEGAHLPGAVGGFGYRDR